MWWALAYEFGRDEAFPSAISRQACNEFIFLRVTLESICMMKEQRPWNKCIRRASVAFVCFPLAVFMLRPTIFVRHCSVFTPPCAKFVFLDSISLVIIWIFPPAQSNWLFLSPLFQRRIDESGKKSNIIPFGCGWSVCCRAFFLRLICSLSANNARAISCENFAQNIIIQHNNLMLDCLSLSAIQEVSLSL